MSQIHNFFDWFNSHYKDSKKPWLILGKGPSFDRFFQVNTNDFVTLGLNHIITSTKVDIAHIMDLDVIENLTSEDLARTNYLIVPYFLHEPYRILGLKGTFHRANSIALQELCNLVPILDEARKKGKLVYYHSDSAKHDEIQNKIRVGSFSASTVIELLGVAGVQNINSLGIDGGSHYSKQFDSLSDKTKLDAGQASFDVQFKEIAQSKYTYGFTYSPLNIETPIKVYVGSQKEQELAFKVLEYSIRKRCSIDVEIFDLSKLIKERLPHYDEVTLGLPQGTSFSLQRFAIPELQNFDGRAIYMDSDMQVFDDLRSLWNSPMKENSFLSVKSREGSSKKPQLSVLLIDCQKTRWNIRDICTQLKNDNLTYSNIFNKGIGLGKFSRDLDCEWNDLEYFDSEKTKLLHYTNMGLQPWLSWENKLATIWCDELLSAISDKAISQELIQSYTDRGWVRPSLITQMEKNIDDPMLLGTDFLLTDKRFFIPPHLFPNSSSLKEASGIGDLNPTRKTIFFRKVFAISRYFLIITGCYSLLRKASNTKRKILTALSTGFKIK